MAIWVNSNNSTKLNSLAIKGDDSPIKKKTSSMVRENNEVVIICPETWKNLTGNLAAHWDREATLFSSKSYPLNYAGWPKSQVDLSCFFFCCWKMLKVNDTTSKCVQEHPWMILRTRLYRLYPILISLYCVSLDMFGPFLIQPFQLLQSLTSSHDGVAARSDASKKPRAKAWKHGTFQLSVRHLLGVLGNLWPSGQLTVCYWHWP